MKGENSGQNLIISFYMSRLITVTSLLCFNFSLSNSFCPNWFWLKLLLASQKIYDVEVQYQLNEDLTAKTNLTVKILSNDREKYLANSLKTKFEPGDRNLAGIAHSLSFKMVKINQVPQRIRVDWT